LQEEYNGQSFDPAHWIMDMSRGPDPEIEPVSILEIFVVSPEPAFVPKELGERLDVSTEGARHQMDRLVERDFLQKKKPGERTVLYWITTEGQEHYAEEAENS